MMATAMAATTMLMLAMVMTRTTRSITVLRHAHPDLLKPPRVGVAHERCNPHSLAQARRTPAHGFGSLGRAVRALHHFQMPQNNTSKHVHDHAMQPKETPACNHVPIAMLLLPNR